MFHSSEVRCFVKDHGKRYVLLLIGHVSFKYFLVGLCMLEKYYDISFF